MKVYIAGPMRGLPDGNLPAFDKAEGLWAKEGHTVFSPAALFRAMPYSIAVSDKPTLTHIMQIDMACVMASDAIALLLGWQQSMGATAELSLAQFLGLKVYDAVTMEEIQPDIKPWSH